MSQSMGAGFPASAWDERESLVSMGNTFKREHYSVFDNPSMTKLILPPDSFQPGGLNTP